MTATRTDPYAEQEAGALEAARLVSHAGAGIDDGLYPAAGGGARSMPDNPHLGELAPGGSAGSSPGNEPPRWQPSQDLAAWSHNDGGTQQPRPDVDLPEGADDAMPSERGVPPQNASDLDGPSPDDGGRWPGGVTQGHQAGMSSGYAATGIAPSSSALLDMGLQSPGETHMRTPNAAGKGVDMQPVADVTKKPKKRTKKGKWSGRPPFPGAAAPYRADDDAAKADAAAKVMHDWTQQSRGHGQPDGHGSDSPGNEPEGTASAVRHGLTGQYTEMRHQLAMGHLTSDTMADGTDRFDPGRVDVHYNAQPSPLVRPFAEVHQVVGAGPIAEAVRHQNGSAAVAVIRAAPVASPYTAAQLGDNAPTGNPAYSRASSAPQPTPQRPAGAAYCDVPGSVSMKNAAPGSQWTTPAPGERR